MADSGERLTRAELDEARRTVRRLGGSVGDPTLYRLIAYARAADDALREIQEISKTGYPSKTCGRIYRAARAARLREDTTSHKEK